MAYRKPSYRPPRRSSGRKPSGPKLQISEVLPIWTPAHTDTVNTAATSIFLGYGITDLESYWQKLRTWIVISVIVFALAGASYKDFGGFLAGAIAGLVAPAVLIWLGVMLTFVALYLAVYCICWAAIWTASWWLLHQ